MRANADRYRWLKRLWLSTATACGLLALPAASALAEAPAPDFGRTANVIDIGYGVFATPMSILGETMRRDLVLRQAGQRLGIEFRFHRFEKGVDSLAPFTAGLLDAAMPTDVVALEAIARTETLLLGYVRHSFSSVVAARGMSMNSLKGRRVAYSPGTSGHTALVQGLMSVGLTERDVSLVAMNVREMSEALAQGKVEAFAAWEPTPTTHLQLHPGRYAVLHRQISPAYFIVSGRMVREQPKAARLLVASLHRAVRWLAKSRNNLGLASAWTIAGMKSFSGTDPQVDEKDIAALTRNDLLNIPNAPQIPRHETLSDSALGRSFDFMKSTEKLPATMSWERVIASLDQTIPHQVLAHPADFALNRFEYEP